MQASWVYYYVNDLDRAVRFYTEALGFPLVFRGGDDWAEIDAGTITIGLHPAKGGHEVPGNAGGTVSFLVDDLENLTKELRARGAVVSDFRENERGKSAMIRDPDGNLLNIIEFSPAWLKTSRYAAERAKFGHG